MSWLARNPKKKVVTEVSKPKVVLLKQAFVGLGLALLFTLLGYAIWHVTRLESLTIKDITVVGGETVSHAEVTHRANEALQGNYVRLIPKRFTWLYPEEDILTSLYAIDRIKQVAIERDKTTLAIAFEEHRPVALWCKEIMSKDCLFLDSQGYAFAAAPYLEGAAFLRYSDKGREPMNKTQAFAPTYIDSTNRFVENAYATLGLNIIHVEKTSEDDLVYHVSGGGMIKVSTALSTDETLENLATLLNSKEFEHIEPGNFKYIDLRFGNKVFVNEVKDEVVDEETATSTEAVAVEGEVAA